MLPRNHEEINECWLSDRDRFAYTGVNSPSRLLAPLVRDVGSVNSRRVEWPEALERSRKGLQAVLDSHGPDQVGILLGPSAASEDGLLASDFANSLGTGNVDHRLRQRDFSLDGHQTGVPWLGSSLEGLSELKSLLIVGSNLARELPLLPVRLRWLQRRKLKAHSIGSRSLAAQLSLENDIAVAPSAQLAELGKVAVAACGKKGPKWLSEFGKPGKEHKKIADSLKSGKSAVLLGAEAINHAQYGALRVVADTIANATGGYHGLLVDGANSVGITLSGAVPHHGFMLESVASKGLNAKEMVDARLRAYVLVGCEPADFADAAAANDAFRNAYLIHIGGYSDKVREYADVLLPSAVFAERTGATVNLEGNATTMYAAVDPPGESRPAWKIFRKLGEMMGLEGFGFDSLEHVRARLIAAGDFTKNLGNDLDGVKELPVGDISQEKAGEGTFERVVEVSHFDVDQVTRRAGPLQETGIAAKARCAQMHPDDLGPLGLAPGMTASLAANGATVECEVAADTSLARGCVRCPMGVDVFAPLGASSSIAVVAAAERGERAVASG